jgi:Glycine rich protein/Concanavalin A-like lectin/glucanases superfamily
MTEISDNSGNSNRLVLNGDSVNTEHLYEKDFKFKSVIQPTGVNALITIDNFGSILATNGNVIVVGTPTHRYNSAGSVEAVNCGAMWVYEKTVKAREKISYKKIKRSQEFSATGAMQTFTVPENVTQLTLHLWGAGGGGEFNGVYSGGRGGYTKATILVNAGATYNVIVGKGGVLGGMTSAFGGGGFLTAANGRGGSGGGRTAFADVQFGDLIVAGGGGGAGLDGNGGHAGTTIGKSGTTVRTVTHPRERDIGAAGGNRGIPGQNLASDAQEYVTYGDNLDFFSKVASNILHLMDDKSKGGNASPATNISGNVYGNGAGGGGWAGGAAGPDGYGYRVNASGTQTLYDVNGSGAGGCGNIELTPGFIPYQTEKKTITSAFMLAGDEANFGDGLNGYGTGGVGFIPGGDGHVMIEWIETEQTEDVDSTWEWTQTGRLTQDIRRSGSKFGTSVAVSTDGQWVFAGCPFQDTDTNDTNALSNSGAVYAFRKENGNWNLRHKILAGGTNGRNANDQFGTAIAFSNGRLFVSAPNHDYDATGTNPVESAGAVFIYTLNSNGVTWDFFNKIVASGANARIPNDNFGYELAVSNDYIAVSSKNGYDINGANFVAGAGTVFVSEFSSSWQQRARIAEVRELNASFGSSISIKDTLLAVEASGLPGRWIYSRVSGNWTLTNGKVDNPTDWIMQAALGWLPYKSDNRFTSSGTFGMKYKGESTNIEADQVIDLANSTSLTTVEEGFIYYNGTQSFADRSQWTLEFWLHPNDIAQSADPTFRNSVISRKDSWGVFTRVAGMATGAGDIHMSLYGTDGIQREFVAGSVSLRKWTHIAFVRDYNEIRTYIGGDLTNTYDISNIGFVDNVNDIYFGYNMAWLPNVPALLANQRFFNVRGIAAYVKGFVPNSHFAAVRLPTATGRGTSTYILDSTTILSGLPTGVPQSTVQYDSSSLRDKETYRPEQQNQGTGLVQVLSNKGSSNWETVQADLVPTGLINKRAATNFGASIVVDDDFIVVASDVDKIGINGNRKNTSGTGSAWVYDIKDNFSYVRKIVANNRARGTVNALGRSADIGANGNMYLSEARFSDIAKVHVNLSYFRSIGSSWNQTNTKMILNWTSSGRVNMLAHRNDSVELTREIVADRRAYAALTATLDSTNLNAKVNVAWPTTNPTYVYARYMDDVLNVDSYNDVIVSDIDGTNYNSLWGDRTFYGNVAKLVFDQPTQSYSYADIEVPGVINSDARFSTGFGSHVKVVGDQIFIGAYLSRFDGYSLANPTAGNIFSYKYSEAGQGWDIFKTYYSPQITSNTNYGSAFDVLNGKIVSRSDDGENAFVQILDEDGNQTSVQTIAGAGTNDGTYDHTALWIDDTQFFVGAPLNNAGSRVDTGIIFSYSNQGSGFEKDSTDYELYFKTPYRSASDMFGSAISMEGTKILFGIPGLRISDDGQISQASPVGGAKIYDFTSDNRWDFQQTLFDSSESAGRRYGTKVQLKGTTAVIQGSYNTTGYNKSFSYDNIKWNLTNTFTGASASRSNALAIINDSLFVAGTAGVSPSSNSLVNSAGAFSNRTTVDGTTWVAGTNNFAPLTTNGAYEQNDIVYNSNINLYAARNNNDRFGYSLGLTDDNKHLVVGSINHSYFADLDTAGVANSGALFTYYFDETTSQYRLNTKLKSTTPVASGLYGQALFATDNNEFVVKSQAPTTNRGTITKVTRLTDTGRTATWENTWTVNALTPVNNESYGAGIAWDSVRDTFVVGVPGRTTGTVASGNFEVISDSANPTRQTFIFDGAINNRNSEDYFGYSMSLYDGHLAVGAPGYSYNNDGTIANSARGAVFTYNFDNESKSFAFERKFTYEGFDTGNYGNWVGINADTLVTFGTTHIPDIKKFSNDVWTTQTVVPSANTSMTFKSASFDRDTSNIGIANSNGSFNINNYNDQLGGALSIEYDGNNWVVGNTGIISKNVLAGGQLINPTYLADTAATGFGFSGTAISPDGQMIAIGSSADNIFENGLPYSFAGTTYNGKIYIFQRDSNDKFVYHSMIVGPTANTDYATKIEWNEQGLFVQQKGFMTYQYQLFDNDYRWKLVRSFMMESATGTSLTTSPEGDKLVMSKPTSAGYPIVTNSGSLHTMVNIDGFWGSNRGPHAGADADITASTGCAGGGGGAGLRGGAAGASAASAILGGAWGGSNLIPDGGAQEISSGAARANSTDPNATGAGAQNTGQDGEHARIVITANGVSNVFDYTGFDQEFVVPDGVTSIDIKMWGAGGGAGWFTNPYYYRTSKGGAGSYVSGTLDVIPGETLSLMVGGGGIAGVANNTPSSRRQSRRYGLGGLGFAPKNNNDVGSAAGGGLAGIMRGDEFLAIAGGGGGGSVRTISSAFNLDGMPGGISSVEEQGNILAQVSDYNLVVAPGIANSRIANDLLGFSVQVVNDNMVLGGAPGHEFTVDGDNLPINSGAIMQYKRSNGQWEVFDKITSLNSITNEYFGTSMEFRNGKLVVVGTTSTNGTLDPTAALPSFMNATTLELLTLDGDTFVNLAKRSLSDAEQLGISATLVDGDMIVLGNPLRGKNETSTTVSQSGGFTTYDYALNPLEISVGSGITYGRLAGDLFGSGVAITSTQIIAGAPGHGYTTNGESYRLNQGALFVFNKQNGHYVFKEKLNQASDATLTNYGRTLQLIGDKLYVGTQNVANFVELKNNANVWSFNKNILGVDSLVTKIVNPNTLVSLDPTSNIGTNGQPMITQAGRAKTYTIGVDGTLTDANEDFSIPGNSNGRLAEDQFGYSVFAGQDFVVVGAPYVSTDVIGNASANTGALFVFNKKGDAWNREIKLVAETGSVSGYGLALAGREGYVLTSGKDFGMARVLQRTAEGIWVNRTDLVGSPTEKFGTSLAVADTTKFIVGIPEANGHPPDIGNLNSSGLVQTWTRVGNTFTDRGYLSAQGISNGRNSGDWFGHSIATNKSYIIVGSPKHSYDALGSNELVSTGAIWIYLRTPNTYPLIGKYVSEVRTENAQYGWTVAINDTSNHIAVGEPGTKQVYLYAFDGADLTLIQTLTGTDDGFGTVISMAGGKLAVGSPNSDNAKGKVDVYLLDASVGQFSLIETIAGFTDPTGTPMINGSVEGDLFGSAVALDTDATIIIGSPEHDYNRVGVDPINDAGAVFLKKV